MADPGIEQRLRDAGAAFIEAHDAAARAIREATDSGMSTKAISNVSGLAPETVAIFLGANADE